VAYRTIPQPCPKCGSEAKVEIDDPQEPEAFWHYSCGCSNMGCENYVHPRRSFDSKGDAIADWNRFVLLHSYSIDYKQTPKTSNGICHTLTHEGDGGIHSAVAYADCLTPWDNQGWRVSGTDGASPTLSEKGSGSAATGAPCVLVHDEPVVMAHTHTNAEIGEGGGCLQP